MNTDRSMREISKGSLGPKLKQICLEFGGANEFENKIESSPSSQSAFSQPLSATEKQVNTSSPQKPKGKTLKSINISINNNGTQHMIVKTPKPLMMSFVGKIKEKIRQVRLRIGFGNIENLKLKQLNWINDISYYSMKQDLKSERLDKGKKKSMTMDGLVRMTRQKIKKGVDEIYNLIDDYHFPRLSKLLKRISVTKLNNRLKLMFDVLMALLIIILLYLYSISFFFSTPMMKLFTLNQEDITSSGGFQMFMIVVLGIFLTDIVLALNTGFYEAGNFVVNRRKIVNNYWKNDFLNDFVSLIPMCSIIFKLQEEASQQWLGLLFLLRFKKLQKIFNNFEDVLLINERYESILSLVNLVTKIISVAHVMACLWHYLWLKNPDPENWVMKRNLIDSPVETRYIYSLYWAITTMITVGYGDITPQNVSETLLCMGSMMTGCAMFGYALNKIGFIFDNMNRNKNDFAKYVKVIDLYMRNKNIEKHLQVRVKKYLEYVWNEEKVQNTKAEEEILSKLSSKLREELLMQSYGRIFNQLPFFSKNFSSEAIRKLVLIIKQVRFYPKETIFERGEKQERSLFIIANGEVDVFYDKARIKRLTKGDFFGEVSFISGLEPDLTVVGSSFGTIYKINRNDFMQTLKEFPLDYETFSVLKDQMILNQNFSGLQITCPSCDRLGHTFPNCSYIRYIPVRSITLNKYIYSPFQERMPHLRAKKRFWSLMQQANIKQRLEEFQKTLPMDEDNPESSIFSLNQWENEEETEQEEVENKFTENEDEENKKESDNSLKHINSIVTTPTNNGKPNEIQNFVQKNAGLAIELPENTRKSSLSSFNRSGSQIEESVGNENSSGTLGNMVDERKTLMVKHSHFAKINDDEAINELKESEERSPSLDEKIDFNIKDSGKGMEGSNKSIGDHFSTGMNGVKARDEEYNSKEMTTSVIPMTKSNAGEALMKGAMKPGRKHSKEISSKKSKNNNISSTIPENSQAKERKALHAASPKLNIVEIENSLNEQSAMPKIPLNQGRRESIRGSSAQPPNYRKRRESSLKINELPIGRGAESPNVKSRRQSFSLNPFFRVDEEGRNNGKLGNQPMILLQLNDKGGANIIASPSFQMISSPQKLRSDQKIMSFSNIPIGSPKKLSSAPKQPHAFSFKEASKPFLNEVQGMPSQAVITGQTTSSCEAINKGSSDQNIDKKDRRVDDKNFEKQISKYYSNTFKDGEVTPTYRSRTNIHQKNKKDDPFSLFLKGMDQGFIFTKYFVHNNMDKVLKNLEKVVRKRKSLGVSLKTGINSKSPKRKKKD